MAALNAISNQQIQKIRRLQVQKRNDEVQRHLPQIRFIARAVAARYRPDVDLDDLISAGFVGLLDALEKFDNSKGIQFKTYAEFRIRGAILDRLRSLDPVPKWLRQKGREIETAYRRLEQNQGRAISREEVAREMGIDAQDLEGLLLRLRARNIAIMDDQSEADEHSLGECPIPSEEPSPFESCFRKEIRTLLRGRISQLPEREQLVLSLRYEKEMSMKEIGEILQVHQSRISQLHNKAIRKLRSEMSSEYGLSETAIA